MKSRRVLLGVLVLGALLGCAGEKDPVVIHMDGKTFTLSEIVTMYDSRRGYGAWERASEHARRRFVNAVANKEVLVRFVRDLYGDSLTGRWKLMFDRWFEKQVVPRFWESLRDSLRPPRSFIDSLGRVLATEVKYKHILCADEETARKLYEEIRSGADFEEVGRRYSILDPARVSYTEPDWVKASGLKKPLDVVLFEQLRPGEYSPPVQTVTFGWHLVMLDSVRTVGNGLSPEELEKVATNEYRNLKMQEVTAKVRAPYDFVVDERYVPVVAEYMDAVWDSVNRVKARGTDPDYRGLKPPSHRLKPEDYKNVLVRWRDSSFTVADFINSLWYVDLDYWPTVGDEGKIARQIVKRMIRWSSFHEAKKRGINKDPEMLRLARNKKDELLAERYHKEYLEKYRDEEITETELHNYWEQHKEKYRSKDLVGYGFLRFPADRKDPADEAYEMLMDGTDMRIVATHMEKKEKRVEFEWMLDVTDGPPYYEITEVALRFTGTPEKPTYTPPQLINGDWYVLRIYHRSKPNTLTFDQAREMVRRDYIREKMDRELESRLEELRRKFHVRIDWGPVLS
ncbi:MAG: hypothetical protein DRH24_19635 [Deltaproteobacteria bacterium]|nr:MAG: hypothetical protein DRH24_19635 [Deltaproteobacteria bacterium]